MSSFITQCPHCETSFNITQAQLKLANGKVRCGFCLQIFSALEQQLFFEDDNPQSLTQDLEPENESGLSPKTSLEDYYSYLERNNEKTQQSYSDSLNDLAYVSPPIRHIDAINQDTNLFVSEQNDYDSDLDNEAGKGLIPETTEAELEELDELEELKNENADNNDAQAIEEIEESPVDAANNNEEDLALENTLEESHDPEEEDYEQEITDEENTLEEKVEEDEKSDESIEQSFEESIEQLSNETLDETLNDQSDELAKEKIEDVSDDEVKDELTPSSTVAATESESENDTKKAELQRLEALYDEEALDSDGGIPVHAISEEPIPIYRQKSRSALFTFVLFFSNILLILGIAAQYTWANIDTYLREARFSLLTGFMCNVADCPAVERFDLSLFSTDQLLVNTHPSIPNALQIDLIFRNTADFAQAFPLLEVNFSDLNRRLVANRLFTPEEYLQQDLQQFTQLMPNSSIQIRLEISDPGAEAINYSLTLRTP